MGRLREFWRVAAVACGLLFGSAEPATAGSTSVSLGTNQGVPLLAILGDTPAAGQPAEFTYALFVAELAAFMTKEVLPDAADEYRESPLGSHWSREMPPERSAFGSHCLAVVTRLGSTLPMRSAPTGLETDASDVAARTGTLFLVARQIWSAFRNDVEDQRSGFSLNPKVGARTIGISFTIHW